MKTMLDVLCLFSGKNVDGECNDSVHGRVSIWFINACNVI